MKMGVFRELTAIRWKQALVVRTRVDCRGRLQVNKQELFVKCSQNSQQAHKTMFNGDADFAWGPAVCVRCIGHARSRIFFFGDVLVQTGKRWGRARAGGRRPAGPVPGVLARLRRPGGRAAALRAGLVVQGPGAPRAARGTRRHRLRDGEFVTLMLRPSPNPTFFVQGPGARRAPRGPRRHRLRHGAFSTLMLCPSPNPTFFVQGPGASRAARGPRRHRLRHGAFPTLMLCPSPNPTFFVQGPGAPRAARGPRRHRLRDGECKNPKGQFLNPAPLLQGPGALRAARGPRRHRLRDGEGLSLKAYSLLSRGRARCGAALGAW